MMTMLTSEVSDFGTAIGKQKNILKVSCFLVIIYITCLDHFGGYIGCEEHGQLAEALLSRTM
jgi:hypothetical protein